MGWIVKWEVDPDHCCPLPTGKELDGVVRMSTWKCDECRLIWTYEGNLAWSHEGLPRRRGWR